MFLMIMNHIDKFGQTLRNENNQIIQQLTLPMQANQKDQKPMLSSVPIDVETQSRPMIQCKPMLFYVVIKMKVTSGLMKKIHVEDGYVISVELNCLFGQIQTLGFAKIIVTCTKKSTKSHRRYRF
jgi:hypothetical protein